MAIGKLMPDKPDLILSGVNRGANLGDDITYSGTVSAAIEGALAGIPSIALSQVYAKEGMGDTRAVRPRRNMGGAGAAPAARDGHGAAHADQHQLPRDPRRRRAGHPRRRGRVSTIMAAARSSKAPTRAAIAITGSACTASNISLGHDSDLEAIDDRYISVTPLQLDLTHDASLAALRSAYAPLTSSIPAKAGSPRWMRTRR